MASGKLRTVGNEGRAIPIAIPEPSATKLQEYNFDQLQANKAAPKRRWGFSVIDFAAMGNQSRRIQEATDNWVDSDVPVSEWVWKTTPPPPSRTDMRQSRIGGIAKIDP